MAYILGPISITGSAITVVGAFEVTGSITSTQTLQVTASSATNALTASYVTSSNIVGTVTSASYALTASYVEGGSSGLTYQQVQRLIAIGI
jgi:hypothetical protein